MISLRQTVEDALRARFGEEAFLPGDRPDIIAVFPALHQEVGDVFVQDDLDEIMVSVEKITHGHFANYDQNVPEESRKAQIVADVVHFLEELFENHVLLWRTKGGAAGGWRFLKPGETPPSAGWRRRHFVWSGPV